MKIICYAYIISLLGAASVFSAVTSRIKHGNTSGFLSGGDYEKYNATHMENISLHGDGDHMSNHSNITQHPGIHVASLNFDYVKQPLIISMFLLLSGVCKLGFHHADMLSSIVPESCLLIILGTIVGAILQYEGVGTDAFPGLTAKLFFLYLLPPIILESAYSLHDRVFFDNIGTILWYAVMGTILNCFIIGPSLYLLASAHAMGTLNITLVECLVFSSLIVAVDPVAVLAIFQEVKVNNVLYFLVFGESLLNDAVTVVLYNMMIVFNKMDEIPIDQIFLGLAAFFTVSLGGIAIGVIFGVLTAVTTKYTVKVRVVEPLSVFVFAYASYLMAELFHLSGIISIIACGLMQAQYAFHNISHKSLTTVTYFCKMTSNTCDCIIFLFLGISIFRFQNLCWHPGFILWALFLCMVVRFLIVMLLTFIANRQYRIRRINLEEQFIMAYGGLRGAVCFSLVAMLDDTTRHRAMFTTATLVVIFFTVFVQGITIKPLVKILRISLSEKKHLCIAEEINDHVTDHIMAGIEGILGNRGEHFWRELLEYYDARYLKHLLQRSPETHDDRIMEMYEKIALKIHYENLAGSKMVQDAYADKYDSQYLYATDYSVMSDESIDEEPIDEEKTLLQLEVSIDIADEDIGVTFQAQAKRRESKLIEHPTTEDIRKMFAPNPQKANFQKLDRNLKNDNEASLLHRLRDKEYRTRRLRKASIYPVSESPEGSTTDMRLPRQSIDMGTFMRVGNRRLSALPGGYLISRQTSNDGSTESACPGFDATRRKHLLHLYKVAIGTRRNSAIEGSVESITERGGFLPDLAENNESHVKESDRPKTCEENKSTVGREKRLRDNDRKRQYRARLKKTLSVDQPAQGNFASKIKSLSMEKAKWQNIREELEEEKTDKKNSDEQIEAD